MATEFFTQERKKIKSLNIDMNGIAAGGEKFSGDIHPSMLDLAEIQGFEFPNDINIDFQIILSGNDYTVRGPIILDFHCECIKCLENFEQKMDLDFILTDSIYQGTHKIRKITKVDLAPFIREEIVVNLPRYPVCKEDCKGLCTQCGQNLNTDKCNCEYKE